MEEKRLRRLVIAVSIIAIVLACGAMISSFCFDTCMVTEQVQGVISPSVDSMNDVEAKEDLNWEVGEVTLKTRGDRIRIEVPVEEETLWFDLELYPSRLGTNSQNRMIGLEAGKSSERYGIRRFIVEQEADTMYLWKPNMDFLGETVVHLGFVDQETGVVYNVQIKENRLDYEKLYTRASRGWNKADQLLKRELTYFSWQTLPELRQSFSNMGSITNESSHSASIDDCNSMENFEDNGESFINELLNTGVAVPVDEKEAKKYIPDSLYRIQKNAEWTQDTMDWNNGTQAGYVFYHMNDRLTGNVFNYVVRYLSRTRYNWDVEKFESFFCLTHHFLIQYDAETGSVKIFPDTHFKERIAADVTIFMKADAEDTEGYFSTAVYHSYKNEDWQKRLAEADVLSTPCIGFLQKLKESLAKPEIDTEVTFFFEKNKTRELKISMEKMKHIRNSAATGNYYYLAMTASGEDITDIGYGYQISWELDKSAVISYAVCK